MEDKYPEKESKRILYNDIGFMVITICQIDAFIGNATARLKRFSFIDLKRALSFDLSVTRTSFYLHARYLHLIHARVSDA